MFKVEKVGLFVDAVPDLSTTGTTLTGTCPACGGKGALRVVRLGANAEATCSNGCMEAEIREAVGRIIGPEKTNGNHAPLAERPDAPAHEPVVRMRVRAPPRPEVGEPDDFADLDGLVYDGPELTAAEIPEPEWLVPGLVAKNVMTMLVGVGKLGKSVLAHQLCVAASMQGVWLDQSVPKTPCLYVNWEDPLGLTRARAIQQFSPAVLPSEYHVMQPPWGTSLNRFISWLPDYLQREGIGLVVIDPLAIAAGWKDENDNAETGPTLRNLQEAAVRSGAAILVVHHIRKGGGEDGMEVRGGSAIFAGIQGFLSFRRKGPGEYQLDTKDKMPGAMGGEKSMLLKREIHTLTWHVTEHLRPQEQEKEITVEQAIREIVTDPGISAPELAARLGVAEFTVRRYLKKLIAVGIVSETMRLKRPEDRGRVPKGFFYVGQRDEA